MQDIGQTLASLSAIKSASFSSSSSTFNSAEIRLLLSSCASDYIESATKSNQRKGEIGTR